MREKKLKDMNAQSTEFLGKKNKVCVGEDKPYLIFKFRIEFSVFH